jgi:hypothetical protein
MADKNEVEQFLKDFKQKLEVFQIYFVDTRKKNTIAYLGLEITPAQRKDIIKGIKTDDYSQGPLDDKIYGNASLWVFGKIIKKKEIYIKISMGRPGLSVICISFHLAEHPMKYPLKNQKK